MERPTGAAVAIAREEKTAMTRASRNHAVAPRLDDDSDRSMVKNTCNQTART
jgi:hypothetical protein